VVTICATFILHSLELTVLITA